MPEYLVRPWDEPEGASTLQSPSPSKAALEWVERYRRVPITLCVKDLDDGQVLKVEVGFNIRVEPISAPKEEYEEYDAEKWGPNVFDSEPDSASDAIDDMMKPLPPVVNEVSEPITMTISPPHPWSIYRVYGVADDPERGVLVLAMSFAAAEQKVHERGWTATSISKAEMEDEIEVATTERIKVRKR